MKTARRYFLVKHPIRNFASTCPHQTQYDRRDSVRETAHRLVRHSTTHNTIEGNFYSPGAVTKASNVQTDFPPLPHQEELLRKATTWNHRSKTSVTKTSYSIRTDWDKIGKDKMEMVKTLYTKLTAMSLQHNLSREHGLPATERPIQTTSSTRAFATAGLLIVVIFRNRVAAQ